MASLEPTPPPVHPTREELQRFMTEGLSPVDTKSVVRHLLTGCPTCTRETRKIWSFGEFRLQVEASGEQADFCEFSALP
jgi:hypothetical protein